MIGLRRALVLIGALGVVVGFGVIAATATGNTSTGWVVLVLRIAVGWSFLAAGLVAWARRPFNRLGPLMVVTSFVWFGTSLGSASIGLLFTVGALLLLLPFAMILHLLFAFPSGTLGSWTSRTIVGAAYVASSVGQVVRVIFSEPTTESFLSDTFLGCDACPPDVILVTHVQAVGDAALMGERILAVLISAAAVVLLAGRLRDAAPGERRFLAPVTWTGIGGLLMLALAGEIDTLLDAPALEEVIGGLGLLLIALFPYAFLVALSRGGFAPGGDIGLLVERLGKRRLGSDDLQQTLRDAIGDPTLTVAYWLPDRDEFVTQTGEPVTLPAPGGEREATLVQREGKQIAALIHAARFTSERHLIDAVIRAAALALENQRLHADLRAALRELQATLAELKASRERIVDAADAERERIARDLHDGAQQQVLVLAMRVAALDTLVDDPDKLRTEIQALAQALNALNDELRSLVHGIMPSELTDRGLLAAVRHLARRLPLTVEVHAEDFGDRRAPDRIERTAYFVVSEALANVLKHSGASEADVYLKAENGRLEVSVSDDGVGGADASAGSGMRGLADRVSAIEGDLRLASEPGEGTVVTAVLPLESDER